MFEVVYVTNTASFNTHCTAGADFAAVSKSMTFEPLDRVACANVRIIDDNLPNEVPESFTVNFKGLEGLLDIPLQSASITIIDNDIGE